MKNIYRFIILGSIISLVYSCVPTSKLHDEEARSKMYHNRALIAENKLQQMQLANDSLNKMLADVREKVNELEDDTAQYMDRYRKIAAMNRNLNDLYEKVIKQNKELLSTSTSERTRLNSQLTNAEEKVQQLEDVLARKDSAVNALKSKITNALLGYDKGDLTVTNKNGKIYVSLAEKLLFPSGKTTINQKGQEALNKLAKVLQKDTSINIMIEGHTDNVPLRSSAAMKDNWDLSVLRATSIVRLLVSNGVEPTQITAAGHSKFMPVATNTTPEGRALNRRTEIILTPNLDEIFQILDYGQESSADTTNLPADTTGTPAAGNQQ